MTFLLPLSSVAFVIGMMNAIAAPSLADLAILLVLYGTIFALVGDRKKTVYPPRSLKLVLWMNDARTTTLATDEAVEELAAIIELYQTVGSKARFTLRPAVRSALLMAGMDDDLISAWFLRLSPPVSPPTVRLV